MHLVNTYVRKWIVYQERSHGINLGWSDDRPSRHTVRVERQQGKDGDPVQLEEPVALFFEGGGFVRHASRDHGIDLEWSGTPVFEWEIRSNSQPPFDRTAHTGALFYGLYNRHQRDFVVYCDRDEGINLRWFRDCKRPPSYRR